MDSVTAASEGRPVRPSGGDSRGTAVSGTGEAAGPVPRAPVPPAPVPSAPVPEEELEPDARPEPQLTPRGLLVRARRTPAVATTSGTRGPESTAEADSPDRTGMSGVPDDSDGGQDPDRSDPYAMAFPPGVSEKLGSYVYLLVDPRTDRPFFAGRGRGDRCFRHLQAARSGTDGGASEPVSGTPAHRAKYPMLDHIREVEAAGRPVRVDILRYGLDADGARLAEAVANDALGLPFVTKVGSQRQSASELGVRLAKQAKFKRDHHVALLRVGGEWADTSYEVARHGWRVGRRWTDPASERSPRWAVIVAGELVVAVYRIEGWEPTPLRSRPPRRTRTPTGSSSGSGRHPDRGSDSGSGTGPGPGSGRSTYRYSFTGQRDEQLERRYVGRNVAAYLGRGPQSRVTFVWCGPEPADTLPR
jgi:hypothetical protein